MTFYPIEIDTTPAYGWEGGPTADVLIRRLRNKQERRNARGAYLQHKFTLPFQNIRDAKYLEEVKAFYMAFGGPENSFLAKDHSDFRHGFKKDQFEPMRFGVGDGATTTFQLTKTYKVTNGTTSKEYVRPITKPMAGVVIYVNGFEDATAVVDLLTGIVTFLVAPENDWVLTWEGEFRVPVRFDDFYLPQTLDNRMRDGDKATNASCTLLEVFDEQ